MALHFMTSICLKPIATKVKALEGLAEGGIWNY